MIDAMWKTVLWRQFGGAIDMLENALDACPDPLWGDRSRRPEFWYVVYHTLFFLDLYLSGPVEEFAPPAPFTLDELDPAGVMPERPYSKTELRAYLEYGRRKCRATIETLTGERASEHRVYGWVEGSVAELLLSNLRHVQHHAAQLNLILRQAGGSPPRWAFRAREDG